MNHFDNGSVSLINNTVKAMLDNTDDFAFVKNKDYVYVGASLAFAKDCACRSGIEAVIGRTDYEIFDDRELAAKYRNDDEELFRTGKSKLEYRESYPDRDGKKRYCLTTKILIRGDNGEPAGILGQSRDITDQVELEKIEETGKRSNAILDSLHNVYDICIYWNLKEDSYIRVYGQKGDINILVPDTGKISDILPAWIENDLSLEEQNRSKDFYDLDTLAERLENNGTLSIEIKTKSKGWLRNSIVPVSCDENGKVISCLWIGEDIDKEKRKEVRSTRALAAATHAAETDALTGLFNRYAYDREVASLTGTNESICFMIIDIDNFKEINDEYGHEKGDEVLRHVANVLKANIRPTDFIARYGGDEFAVILRKFYTNKEKIDEKYNRVRQALIDPVIDIPKITLSYGIVFSEEGFSKEVFIKADEALYMTKKNGRDGYTVFGDR